MIYPAYKPSQLSQLFWFIECGSRNVTGVENMALTKPKFSWWKLDTIRMCTRAYPRYISIYWLKYYVYVYVYQGRSIWRAIMTHNWLSRSLALLPSDGAMWLTATSRIFSGKAIGWWDFQVWIISLTRSSKLCKSLIDVLILIQYLQKEEHIWRRKIYFSWKRRKWGRKREKIFREGK